jgi:glutamate--cysteine ligase catalytic subunit
MFPHLGASDSVSNVTDSSSNGIGNEQSALDHIVSTEARYQAANKNIPARRETLSPITLAKFKDSATDSEPIRLDETIFGPGHCGLQATFQASDEDEARLLHDQLIPLGPILLALTAATPIYKGYLSDVDARWNQISQAVDDRSPQEAQSGKGTMHPRWFSNPMYVANVPSLREEFQFKDLAFNQDILEKLQNRGLDPLLARFFAHVFIRDPIIMAEEDLIPVDASNRSAEASEDQNTNHFDSLNGTVWPHVRLKLPPPSDEKIGWRVEFRPMELQVTDFENATFCIFVSLLRRIIIERPLDFYMPLEKVLENMELAHSQDAVREQRFYFRKNFNPLPNSYGEPEFGYFTVNEIINGSDRNAGLLSIIEDYFEKGEVDLETQTAFRKYLNLVSKRASGQIPTAARWMREFVRSHSHYKHDSVVSTRICYDMIEKLRELSEGHEFDGSGSSEYSKMLRI